MSLNEQDVEREIDLLFRGKYAADLAEGLRAVASYFELLAERIDYRRGILRAKPLLVGRFEAVYLWLSDQLLVYPDTIRDQVRELVQHERLCEQFAVLASLSGDEDESIRIPRPSSLAAAIFRAANIAISADNDSPFPASRDLFRIKIALRRLAQILHYASSLDMPEYEEVFSDVRANYDPNILDKNQLGVLVNILRIQVSQVPDPEHRQTLMHAIDKIEAEIRRPKVKWGMVIAGFFVLFGFLSDLQSLYPGVYDTSIRTVEAIISMIHKDAQVQRKQSLLPPINGSGTPHPQSGEIKLPLSSSPPELGIEDYDEEN
jgi:hypothetical protein